MEERARRELNLSVLKRYDPSITDIITTSSHVVVYDFDEDRQSWAKRGVEGTLFLIQRSSLVLGNNQLQQQQQQKHKQKNAKYGIVILNRLSLEDFVVDLSSTMEVQVLGDYIIYKTTEDLVQGLWLYEASDRDRLSKLLQSLSQAEEEGVPSIQDMLAKANSSKESENSTTGQISILDMLAKAHSAAAVASNSVAPLYTIGSLLDLWNVLESMGPSSSRSTSLDLSEPEFRHRLLFVAPSLFSAYVMNKSNKGDQNKKLK